jgi:hypothetical protein
MTNQLKTKYQLAIFFKKTGNHFESYITNTKKEALQILRDRKLEMKNWADEEEKPTGSQITLVLI